MFESFAYPHIGALEKAPLAVGAPTEVVAVQEKLDGANLTLEFVNGTQTWRAYSRNQKFDLSENFLGIFRNVWDTLAREGWLRRLEEYARSEWPEAPSVYFVGELLGKRARYPIPREFKSAKGSSPGFFVCFDIRVGSEFFLSAREFDNVARRFSDEAALGPADYALFVKTQFHEYNKLKPFSRGCSDAIGDVEDVEDVEDVGALLGVSSGGQYGSHCEGFVVKAASERRTADNWERTIAKYVRPEFREKNLAAATAKVAAAAPSPDAEKGTGTGGNKLESEFLKLVDDPVRCAKRNEDMFGSYFDYLTAVFEDARRDFFVPRPTPTTASCDGGDDNENIDELIKISNKNLFKRAAAVIRRHVPATQVQLKATKKLG